MPDASHVIDTPIGPSAPEHKRERDSGPLVFEGHGVWVHGEVRPIQFEMDEDIHQKLLSFPQGFLGHPVSLKTEHLPDGAGRRHCFQKGTIYAHPQAGIHAVWGPTHDHYVELGETTSALGYPLSDLLVPAMYENERMWSFQYGQIYWSQALGAHEVHGAILQKYATVGQTPMLGPAGFLGFPNTDELATPDGKGRYNHFTGGSIYWTPETGACEIHGPIRDKWASMGWEQSLLGYPVSDVLTAPDGKGEYTHFQHGSIYRAPGVGAFEVHGAIREKWANLGWEQSFLGYPTTDECGTPDGKGRYNHFQGGSIYWTPKTGACEVHGPIRDKWASIGWEQSLLGYPVTDECQTPDGIGQYGHFQGGSIYSTSDTGTFEIHGPVREKWAALGWEQGFLGYPITDECGTPDGIGRYTHFQNGSIYWTPQTGACEVHGAIRDLWSSLGWEQSWVGYPTTDELATADGQARYGDFQNGTIFWNSTQGAAAVHGPVPCYIFRLASFCANTTRAPDDDEPHEAITVQVGNLPPATNAWTDGDDIEEDEWHTVNREIGPITVEDSATQILFNFIITNQGHGDTSQIESLLKEGSKALLAYGGLSGNPLALATAVVGGIISVLFANCDGIVASDQLQLVPQQLRDWTGAIDGNIMHAESRGYPGTTSPTGCGDTSYYTVNFDIRRW